MLWDAYCYYYHNNNNYYYYSYYYYYDDDYYYCFTKSCKPIGIKQTIAS